MATGEPLSKSEAEALSARFLWAVRATARSAHHEAGHAVATVYRGGQLVSITLADDWHKPETIDWDSPAGNTRTRQDQSMVPFTSFAGPWAEAVWAVQFDPDEEGIEFDDILFYAYDDELGVGDDSREWDNQWMAELEFLWPAIGTVAQWLIDGETVTHDDISALLAELENEHA